MDVIVDESSEDDHDTLSEQSESMSDASQETIDNQYDDPDYDPRGTPMPMDDTQESSNEAQPQPSPAPPDSQPVPAPPDSQPSGSVANYEEVAKLEDNFEDNNDRPLAATQNRSDDDGQCCTICFEPWTNSSEHRLVSLRCGHLFGRSCITRWLQGQNTRCPQCNSRARRSEIRNIYAKTVKVLDSSERDKALYDLAKESELRRAAEMNAAEERFKRVMAVQECERLKKELMEAQRQLHVYRSGLNVRQSQLDASKISAFSLVQSIEISKSGGCRVVDSSSMLGMLLVSQPSSNPLFQGSGLRKISTHDMKAAEFMLVHQKSIKDMAFHPHDGLVLTASQDKTLKITNVLSNTVVQTYTVSSDAWSCTWDTDNSVYFYGGLKTGEVLVYDIRVTNRYVCELPKYGAKTPVVSLQYLRQPISASHRNAGAIVGKLSDCSFHIKSVVTPNEYKTIPLPTPGPVVCLSSVSSGHCLISCRPSLKTSNVTHTLCDFMTAPSGDVVCVPFRTVLGGRSQVQLTRTKLLDHPDKISSSLVCAGDEDSHGILVWDGSSGECLVNLKTNSAVLDLCGMKINDKTLLTALTDKSLLLYNWNGV